MGRRLLLFAALALLVVSPSGAGVAPGAEPETAQRAIHLLEYVAVDYPVAVRSGAVISELEYREQIEFVGQVRWQLESLGVAKGDPLSALLAALDGEIRSRGPESTVAEYARALADGLRSRFGVHELPLRAPSLERGRVVYAEACASCHGAEGQGDGPAGSGLDPRPTDFTDRARMLSLPPSALYRTITFGIPGTAMAGFAKQLDEADRYALALFVGSLAFDPEEVERGHALVQAGARRLRNRIPSLSTLMSEPAAELANGPQELAIVAYLRTHPEELAQGELSIGRARRTLRESWDAHRLGEHRRALDLAVSAYLDGFEPVEPALDAVAPELRVAIESEFLRYRAELRAGSEPARVEQRRRALQELLAEAQDRLAGGGLEPTPLFVGALTIVCREGIEAILIVAALCGILVRAERRAALRYVHAGWLAALGAGALTWLAAQRLVELSGAEREVIEGVSALLAMAILFYVSFWLISKLEASHWQAFLSRTLHTALSRGSLWTLAAVSFVAVFRESIETVLFFQALWAQAGPSGAEPVLLGAATGAVLLALPAAAILRFGTRLPIRRFFTASSILLYLVAVVLAGEGVAALQEANWLPATWVDAVRIEWLGIYPTVEGLALQGLLVLLALAGLPWTMGALRSGAAQRVG